MFLLMFLPALTIGQAAGQNILKFKYAGENQVVLYDCDAAYNTVTLGNPQEASGANEDEVQYYWEIIDSDGMAFFPDENIRKQPITNACISSEDGTGDFVFCCTRISKYGYQKEYVTVTMKNTIEVIASPNQDCWAHGDYIKTDQFEIDTNPKGFKSHIILDSDSRKAINHNHFSSHDTQEIHFISDDPARYPVEENTYTISVIEESNDIGAEIPISSSVIDMIKAYKSGGAFLDKLKKVEDLTKDLRKFGPFKYEWGFNGGSLGYTHGTECCKGAESMFMDFSGGVKASLKFSLDYPIPVCPAVRLFVDFEGSASVSLADIKWTYSKGCETCDCGESKFVSFAFSGELTGGASLAAGSRDFLSVSGYVTGGVQWPGKLILPRIRYGSLVNYLQLIEMDDVNFYGKVGVKAVLLVTTFTKEIKFAD